VAESVFEENAGVGPQDALNWQDICGVKIKGFAFEVVDQLFFQHCLEQ